jgi:hypothetical protein
MRRHISKSRCAIQRASTSLAWLFVIGVFATAADVCCAMDGDDALPLPLRAEIRSGGVIEESYNYHRQQPAHATVGARSIEPAGGWYGYGFPVSTCRWGWFGAAHYYPFVWWHDGYYGDCCRYAYRRGY